jgi:hypothetical protein
MQCMQVGLRTRPGESRENYMPQRVAPLKVCFNGTLGVKRQTKKRIDALSPPLSVGTPHAVRLTNNARR